MSVPMEAKAATGLEQLGLKVAAAHLDQVAQQAAADAWSYTHFLGHLLEGELADRHRRAVDLSMQFARFPARKLIEDFDFDAQPGVDRRLVEELATLRFCAEGRNVVLLGPPGVGKTHLAIGLGVALARTGGRVYFTTAVELARKLAKAAAEHHLSRELKNLTRPSLLIIDEVGYLTLDAAAASLLFQVIAERYEKGRSIVLTGNKPFADWAEVFAGDAVMASAALDRLLHRATVLNIRGQSYRLAERRQSGSEPTASVLPVRKSRKKEVAD